MHPTFINVKHLSPFSYFFVCSCEQSCQVETGLAFEQIIIIEVINATRANSVIFSSQKRKHSDRVQKGSGGQAKHLKLQSQNL